MEDWKVPLGEFHLQAPSLVMLEDAWWWEMELNCLSYKEFQQMTGSFNFKRYQQVLHILFSVQPWLAPT